MRDVKYHLFRYGTATIHLRIYSFFAHFVEGVVVPIDKPNDDVQKQKPKMKSVEIKRVKQGRGGLRIRTSSKAPTLFSIVQDKLAEGIDVEILERVVSGNYTWVRIGYRQWVCEREGGTTYLE